MAKKQNRPKSEDKCPKVWEKNRRDKFKGLFDELSRLLPNHDPATPLSRMKVVHCALTYIRELQAQNEDLLNGGFDDIHRKKIEDWKRRVKELVCRVDQLTGILRTANIHVPPLAVEGIPMWVKTRPKQWTDKISIPEVKVQEVIQEIAEAKRKKKQTGSLNGKRPAKRRKKTTAGVDDACNIGSKENLPGTKMSISPAVEGQKGRKQLPKISARGSVLPTPTATVVSVKHAPTAILQGSVMTPLPQPSAFILTGQGNLLPVLTPSANLLTPVVINKPPVLVVQQPSVPKPLPVIFARPPLNKRRIQRESTVMTYTNKIPIPALSTHSHSRKGGKCTAHKTVASIKSAAASSTTSYLPTPSVVSNIAESATSEGNRATETSGTIGTCIATSTVTIFDETAKGNSKKSNIANGTTVGESHSLDVSISRENYVQIDPLDRTNSSDLSTNSASEGVKDAFKKRVAARIDKKKIDIISPLKEPDPAPENITQPHSSSSSFEHSSIKLDVKVDNVRHPKIAGQSAFNVEPSVGRPHVPVSLSSSSNITDSLDKQTTSKTVVKVPCANNAIAAPEKNFCVEHSKKHEAVGASIPSLTSKKLIESPAVNSDTFISQNVENSSESHSILPKGDTSTLYPLTIIAPQNIESSSKIASSSVPVTSSELFFGYNSSICSQQSVSNLPPLETIFSHVSRTTSEDISHHLVDNSTISRTLQSDTALFQPESSTNTSVCLLDSSDSHLLETSGNSEVAPWLSAKPEAMVDNKFSLSSTSRASSNMGAPCSQLKVYPKISEGETANLNVFITSVESVTTASASEPISFNSSVSTLSASASSCIQAPLQMCTSMKTSISQQMPITTSLSGAMVSYSCTQSFNNELKLSASSNPPAQSLFNSSCAIASNLHLPTASSETFATAPVFVHSATSSCPNLSTTSLTSTTPSAHLLPSSQSSLCHSTFAVENAMPPVPNLSTNIVPPSLPSVIDSRQANDKGKASNSVHIVTGKQLLYSSKASAEPFSTSSSSCINNATTANCAIMPNNPINTFASTKLAIPSSNSHSRSKVSNAIRSESSPVVTGSAPPLNSFTPESTALHSSFGGGKALNQISESTSSFFTQSMLVASQSKVAPPSTRNPPSNLLKTGSIAVEQPPILKTYMPPMLSTVPTASITTTSWSTPHNLTASSLASNITSEVSWSPLGTIKTPHLPHVPTSDRSWLAPSSVISFNEGSKTLSSTPSSWRPLPNDIFWNSSGDNWGVSNNSKDLAHQEVKKMNNLGKSAAVDGKIAIAENNSIIPNDSMQWPMKASTSTEIGLYPFCPSGAGFYSTAVPVPVCEPTWTSNISKTFSHDDVYPSGSQLNKTKTVSSSLASKTQCMEQVYYPPTIPYMPPASSYYPQVHSGINSYSNSAILHSSCPSSIPSTNQSIISKTTPKQSLRSSVVTSKAYSNVSSLASSAHVASSIKSVNVDVARQISSTQSKTTSTFPQPSSKTLSETFYPSSHYTVADSGLYNPFTESSLASSLLKQTLPDNSSYTVNFGNAFGSESSSSISYPLNVPKNILSEPPYSLTSLKTSMTNSHSLSAPSYMTNVPNIFQTDPVLFPNNPSKVNISETVQVTSAAQSAAVISSSQTSSSVKQGGKERAVNVKGMQLNTITNMGTSPSCPVVKGQEPIDSTGGHANKFQSTAKCTTTAETKTNDTSPIWNSSFFPQSQTANNLLQGSTSWSQSEYSCLGETKDGRPKPPINWMTGPEDQLHSRYSRPFDRRNTAQQPQNTFEFCGTEDDESKGKPRKKGEDFVSQDYCGWPPMKVDSIVVPGTLPTLVGDLALGGDPIPGKRMKSSMFTPDTYPVVRCEKDSTNGMSQEPFANLSRNIFDFTQNDIPKSSSTETIVLKNIFELPAPTAAKQKPPQGQNSFLSVSQLVETNNMETSTDKNEYSYYTQKPGKTKRSTGWKCNEKKCQQNVKNCNNYSAEALLRSQDAIPSEPDFINNPATFPVDFPQDPNLLDISDLQGGQIPSKQKTYQRYRKQDCWKGQDLKHAPQPITFTPMAGAPFPSVPGKPPPPGKPCESVPIPFSYMPDSRLSAPPPLPPCNSSTLPFPRFPGNPPTSLLPAPNFPHRRVDGVQFTGFFPSPPGRACAPTDGSLPPVARYSGPKKPFSYSRSSKSICPPFNPSFPNEVHRKSAAKSQQPAPPLPFPPPAPLASGASGSSLANFNLSTIFPEMNKKGNYPYP